jgi:hypothetical protein
LDVTFTHPDVIWPWTCWMGVFITVLPGKGVSEQKIASGKIRVSIVSDRGEVSTFDTVLKVNVVPTPPREKRVLWDQFHNLRYPAGYFPRDNLSNKGDILDWYGDHPHSNFRQFARHIRETGYFLEVLGHDFTCFDAQHYGTLMMVDSEEDYFPEEIEKLADDVKHKGLSLLVMAEWFNVVTMKSVCFDDDNTKTRWCPVTGGSNVPALNRLLAPYGISLGDRVLAGEIMSNSGRANFKSGTSLVTFPKGGFLSVVTMQDETEDARKGQSVDAGVLGVLPGKVLGDQAGSVMVYGDSTCLDDNMRQGPDCNWLPRTLINFATQGQAGTSDFFSQDRLLAEDYVSKDVTAPHPTEGSEQMPKYSRVLNHTAGVCLYRGQAGDVAALGDSVAAWGQTATRPGTGDSAPLTHVSSTSASGAHHALPKTNKVVRRTQGALYIMVAGMALFVLIVYLWCVPRDDAEDDDATGEDGQTLVRLSRDTHKVTQRKAARSLHV